MRIVYRLSLGDVVYFQLYEFDHAERNRARRVMATWGGALLVLALFGVIAVIARSWAFLVLGGVFAAVYAYVVPNLIRQNVRSLAVRLYASDAGRRLLGRRELEVTSEGLLARTEDGGETTSPWAEVRGVRRADAYAFVYLGGLAAHVVPLRAVEAGDARTFLREVERRAGANA